MITTADSGHQHSHIQIRTPDNSNTQCKSSKTSCLLILLPLQLLPRSREPGGMTRIPRPNTDLHLRCGPPTLPHIQIRTVHCSNTLYSQVIIIFHLSTHFSSGTISLHDPVLFPCPSS